MTKKQFPRKLGAWVLFVSCFAFLVSSYPANAAGSTYKLVSKLLGDSDPDQYALSVDKLFTTDEANFGQNMYLTIYNSTIGSPAEGTVQEIAKAYGLSLLEAQQVIDGSISPLLQTHHNDEKFTQVQALQLATDIKKRYEDELAYRELKGQLESQTQLTELFANGDLSDSGFDLLYDLDTIEYYLFVDKTPNIVNKTIHTLDKLPPPKPVQLDVPQTNYAQYDTISTPLDSSGNASSDSSSSSESSSAGNSKAAENTKNLVITGDLMCSEQPSLNDAIDNYENNPGAHGDNTAPPPASSGSGTSPSPAAQPGNTGSNPSGGDFSQQQSALSDYPMDPGLCDDIDGGSLIFPKKEDLNKNSLINFCFSIRSKFTTYGTYQPEKPCIQCTVAKINESFKKTVSHSLVPSKLTGNLFESAKCKEGVNLSDLLDMNIFLVPMPIMTPPKYSAWEGHNIQEQWNLFAKKYLPFHAQAEQNSEPLTDEDNDLYNETLREVMQNGGGKKSQIEVLNEITAILAQKKGEQQEAVQQALDSVNLAVTLDRYQPIEQELSRMASFFEIFNNYFSEIQQKTCPNILSKPVK